MLLPETNKEKLRELNSKLRLWRRDFLVRYRVGAFDDLIKFCRNPIKHSYKELPRDVTFVYQYLDFAWIDKDRDTIESYIPLICMMLDGEGYYNRNNNDFVDWKKRWTRFRGRFRYRLHIASGVKRNPHLVVD